MIPTRHDSEWIHGVYFYLSAMLGGLLGMGLFTPAVGSGEPDSDLLPLVAGAIVGSSFSSLAWLVFKYRCLKPDPPYKRR